METSEKGQVVCVTGGSGFIGSCLVSLLLGRGYTFHATVKDLKDERETAHLKALEGADTRLRLFQIDLLDYDSIVAAVASTTGVFHLASPCIVDQVRDPQRELLDPAIKGTNNVLRAAKEAGVRRVVVTSSISAIIPSPDWPADVVKGEDCWADADYCNQNGTPDAYASAWQTLKNAACVLFPGGFGDRGVIGMIFAAKYARENNVPYLGICFSLIYFFLSEVYLY